MEMLGITDLAKITMFKIPNYFWLGKFVFLLENKFEYLEFKVRIA